MAVAGAETTHFIYSHVLSLLHPWVNQATALGSHYLNTNNSFLMKNFKNVIAHYIDLMEFEGIPSK